MNELKQSLDKLKILWKPYGTFGVACQRGIVKFECEINAIEDVEGLHILRFRQKSLEIGSFRDTCSLLLSSLAL